MESQRMTTRNLVNLHEYCVQRLRRDDDMKWPGESVPESSFFTYPDGVLTVNVKSVADTETKNGKYAIKVETRVVEPKAYRNQPFNFLFVIGTAEDPSADNEETWTQPPSVYAAGRYKSFLKAAGVPATGDTVEEGEAVVGKTILVEVGHHEDDAGRVYNDTNAFYALGDQPAAGAPRRPGNLKKASPKPAAAPRVADDGDDADWD